MMIGVWTESGRTNRTIDETRRWKGKRQHSSVIVTMGASFRDRRASGETRQKPARPHSPAGPQRERIPSVASPSRSVDASGCTSALGKACVMTQTKARGRDKEEVTGRRRGWYADDRPGQAEQASIIRSVPRVRVGRRGRVDGRGCGACDLQGWGRTRRVGGEMGEWMNAKDGWV